MANSTKFQLLMSNTDHWGHEWPADPQTAAAWFVEGTESMILPLCYGRESVETATGYEANESGRALIPLTKEDVLNLFKSYRFDYCC